MDSTIIICAIGFVFAGVIIGYSIRSAIGNRHRPRPVRVRPLPAVIRDCRCRLESKDILSAEILEENRK